MSVECQVNVKSQSELDIGGRETCLIIPAHDKTYLKGGIENRERAVNEHNLNFDCYPTCVAVSYRLH